MSPFFDDGDHADVEPTYEADPWPGLAGLSERHLALLRELWRNTKPGTAVAHVKQATLAEAIGLRGEPRPGREAQGSRQVRRLMKELVRRGLVQETPRKVPSREGGRRYGASDYTLKVPLTALPPPPPPLGHDPPPFDPPLGHGASPPLGQDPAPPLGHAPTARTRPEVPSSQVAPLGHDSGCPSKNVPTGQRPTASKGGKGSASRKASKWGWKSPLDEDLVVVLATLQRVGLKPIVIEVREAA